jgi:hypothetical protein
VPEFEDTSAEAGGEALAGDAATAERAVTPVGEMVPTVAATLIDGPLEGRSLETDLVEARPPKTIDALADDGSTCRYCLADWVQSGRSAAYTFLYRV